MTTRTEIERTGDTIARDVVATHAAAVGREGAFPEASVDALGRAGLLGVLSAPDVGGSGLGLRVERLFRDARASTVMAPTTDALYDFIGRVECGMELFG